MQTDVVDGRWFWGLELGRCCDGEEYVARLADWYTT